MTCECFCKQCQHCEEEGNKDPKKEYARHMAYVENVKIHLKYWAKIGHLTPEKFKEQMGNLETLEEAVKEMYKNLI